MERKKKKSRHLLTSPLLPGSYTLQPLRSPLTIKFILQLPSSQSRLVVQSPHQHDHRVFHLLVPGEEGTAAVAAEGPLEEAAGIGAFVVVCLERGRGTDDSDCWG